MKYVQGHMNSSYRGTWVINTNTPNLHPIGPELPKCSNQCSTQKSVNKRKHEQFIQMCVISNKDTCTLYNSGHSGSSYNGTWIVNANPCTLYLSVPELQKYISLTNTCTLADLPYRGVRDGSTRARIPRPENMFWLIAPDTAARRSKLFISKCTVNRKYKLSRQFY